MVVGSMLIAVPCFAQSKDKAAKASKKTDKGKKAKKGKRAKKLKAFKKTEEGKLLRKRLGKTTAVKKLRTKRTKNTKKLERIRAKKRAKIVNMGKKLDKKTQLKLDRKKKKGARK